MERSDHSDQIYRRKLIGLLMCAAGVIWAIADGTGHPLPGGLIVIGFFVFVSARLRQ